MTDYRSMGPGAALHPGDRLLSPSGQVTLNYQTDGNVVLRTAGVAVWQSGTRGRASDRLVFQTDANLVLRNGDTAVWVTGGHADAVAPTLSVQDDGNLVIRAGSSTPAVKFTTGTHFRYPATLGRGATLAAGGHLDSPGGLYTLQMQTDGNLVHRRVKDGKALWASGTAGVGDGASVSVQTDGNVVLRDRTGRARWQLGLVGRGTTVLQVQDDGNLVAYAGQKPVWATSWLQEPAASFGSAEEVTVDVSYYQAAVNDSYARKFFIFRSTDGTFRDPKAAANLAWAEKAAAAGRIGGYAIYHVFEQIPTATQVSAALAAARCGRYGLRMLDVESWGGKIRGDQSDAINALAVAFAEAEFGGDMRRVYAYGNGGDLASLYPRRRPDVAAFLASYGSRIKRGYVANQIGQQYTDGDTQWGVPAGLPVASAPFGNCDHNLLFGSFDAWLHARGLRAA